MIPIKVFEKLVLHEIYWGKIGVDEKLYPLTVVCFPVFLPFQLPSIQYILFIFLDIWS